MSKVLKDCHYFRNLQATDLILDRKKIEKVLGQSLLSGLNKITHLATSEKYSCLSKGLKININFDVIVPVDNNEFCLYVTNTFEIEGRGSKSNGERLFDSFFSMLVEKECIYDYQNEIVPEFNENEPSTTLFIDVERSGDFRSKYMTVDYLKFDKEETTSNLYELKESTDETLYIYTDGKKKDANFFIAFHNALYQLNDRDYVKSYKNYKNIFSNYRGLDNNLIVTNKGSWIKVRNLEMIEPSEIMFDLKECNIYGKSNTALVFNNEILFHISENIKPYNGNDTWYTLSGLNNTIILYSKNDNSSINIEPINGEIAFRTDFKPGNSAKSSFDTSYLTNGKYIKAEISIDGEKKTMVLAPISVGGIKEYSRDITIYQFRTNLYGIVGEYTQIGFHIDTQFWNSIRVYITEAPQEEHLKFLFSYKEVVEELNKYDTDKIPTKLTFVAYDRRFKDSLFELKEGDTVTVISEPQDDSQIKGLNGIIEDISDNRKLITVKFFNFFKATMSIDCIEKVDI